MHKYICVKCSQPAKHRDFYQHPGDKNLFAVYAYCTTCKTHSWGGLSFHPAMNELFNQLFQANFDYVATGEEEAIVLEEG